MSGNILLFAAAALPMLLSPLVYALGRKRAQYAVYGMIAVCAVTLGGLLALLYAASRGAALSFVLDGFCGQGLRMRADGFRALYACVAGCMWLITSIFSLDYLRGDQRTPRYAFFTLLTFGATVGLFLSDALFSTFLFFEVMSLASYPWVAHEEEPAAMRAAQTYLYIAVIGGLVMLMGLFLLPNGLALCPYGELSQRAAGDLWLPALLVLVGFAAKAGSFPLHIWLPKAHPVAPAPASALLSGILTKAGVFGMLVLSCLMMRDVPAFGDLLFRLGVITMLLGGALAIASGNLKRTLACSSLSQIGFIMVGVGLMNLLGEENGLAAYGAVGHMVNHSLFKLVLFLCAGVVAMNTHKLKLSQIRGYGRNKPLLHVCFLLGALGISGVPLFSGYLSKSLLHEGILEWIAHLNATGRDATVYQLSEYAFLLAGGMTFCYMLKLYLCLFVQKNPSCQAEYDKPGKYLSRAPRLALLAAALCVPVIGLLPEYTVGAFGALSQEFLGAATPALPIRYFSGENLLGAAKSLLIGGALYGLTVLAEAKKLRLPFRMDLENDLYRPLCKALCGIGYGLALALDRLMDGLRAALLWLGGLLARLLDGAWDGALAGLRKTALAPFRPATPPPVGNRFTFAVGSFLDRAANATVHRKNPTDFRFVAALAAAWEEAAKDSKKLARSISFGLLLFCLGLFCTLAYLLY